MAPCGHLLFIVNSRSTLRPFVSGTVIILLKMLALTPLYNVNKTIIIIFFLLVYSKTIKVKA